MSMGIILPYSSRNNVHFRTQRDLLLWNISIETIEVAFFVAGLETLQSNLHLFINNYTKYLIIKLSLLKKSLKKRNNEIITQYLTGATVA
jgi:hypothetical protein